MKKKARNFNVIVVGDTQVGKTALILRYTQNGFKNSFSSTLGVDFQKKELIVNNTRVFMQIWDTSGQERFRTITRNYYAKAMGVILVYDSTDPKTYQEVNNWMIQIETHASNNIVKVLVASKCDQQSVKISQEKGKELADSYGIPFFMTSAMTGQNINDVFNYIAEEIFKRELDTQLNSRIKIVLNPEINKQKQNCCW